MEIVGQDGAKIAVRKGHKAVFGRGFGFNTDDRTVSRCHAELEVNAEAGSETEPRVSFEVLGKNPIWVRSKTDGEVRVFRRLEKGELVVGDWFCVSGKTPSWFSLRKVGVEVEQGEKKRALEVESELAESFEDFDVSGIDPVKEFGFVVMGHEFDVYPKHKIHNMKSWDWFLEEPRKESEDDDEEFEFEKKVRTSGKRKKRKGEENDDDDDEWTGESEDDKELAVNMERVKRPKYSTRSKDRGNEPRKYRKSGKNSSQKKAYVADEDEDEETLGGFIVGDDDVNQEETDDDEEEEEEEDEEEEEFVEDEDDDEDEDDELDD